jgi:hypothetical protein
VPLIHIIGGIDIGARGVVAVVYRCTNSLCQSLERASKAILSFLEKANKLVD